MANEVRAGAGVHTCRWIDKERVAPYDVFLFRAVEKSAQFEAPRSFLPRDSALFRCRAMFALPQDRQGLR
jgi:hypothetical protein